MTNLAILSLKPHLIWLELGFKHLLDFNGYDHMLFLWMSFLALTWAGYKRALLQVSVFTLAHSLTLALSVFYSNPISSDWIERLIALSIGISALVNLLPKTIIRPQAWVPNALIFIFGLIHGMGFSGLLRSLLGPDSEVWSPLLFFNIGLEIGQIAWVALLIMVQSGLRHYKKDWFMPYQVGSAWFGLILSMYLFISRF